MSLPNQKACTRCGQVKSLSEFNRNKDLYLGRAIYCKPCQAFLVERSREVRLAGRRKNAPVPPERKVCLGCGEEKAAADFYQTLNSRDGLRPRCRRCCSLETMASKKRRYHKDPQFRERCLEANRRAYLTANYAMTTGQYQEMLERSGGVCEICGKPETWSGRKRLAIDHDHETGQIRGLLCASCNKALGGFRDDARLLLRAAKYLIRSWRKPQPG